MKVCDVDRNVFYLILNAAFKALSIKPAIAELGVLRGDNALKMYEAMSPELLVLIDSWNISGNDGYSPFKELPPWVAPLETYGHYYGGPIWDQQTFDANYEVCKKKFAEMNNVHLIREETIAALQRIKPETGVDKFDLVYVDASHQYEYVLRDLMYYQHLVAPEGCMMLNDCCHSADGMRQNIGVLEALTSFLKRADFTPVALTNTDWSDVILVRKNSTMERVIDDIISNSRVSFVGIPPQLISAAKIVQGAQRKNISFY